MAEKGWQCESAARFAASATGARVMRAGQVSVAVLIDKFVSATALIKFQEVQQTLSMRKDKEVCFSRRCSRRPPASTRAALPVPRVRVRCTRQCQCVSLAARCSLDPSTSTTCGHGGGIRARHWRARVRRDIGGALLLDSEQSSLSRLQGERINQRSRASVVRLPLMTPRRSRMAKNIP
jgi:hypothetical protein